VSQEFKKYIIFADTTLNLIVASDLMINKMRSTYKINVAKTLAKLLWIETLWSNRHIS
jgi:hypothetical protein